MKTGYLVTYNDIPIPQIVFDTLQEAKKYIKDSGCEYLEIIEISLHLSSKTVEDDRKYRIALLKENQRNYDMGLITTEEYQEQIKRINKH